jgi:hypothetical protein
MSKCSIIKMMIALSQLISGTCDSEKNIGEIKKKKKVCAATG